MLYNALAQRGAVSLTATLSTHTLCFLLNCHQETGFGSHQIVKGFNYVLRKQRSGSLITPAICVHI